MNLALKFCGVLFAIYTPKFVTVIISPIVHIMAESMNNGIELIKVIIPKPMAYSSPATEIVLKGFHFLVAWVMNIVSIITTR